MTALRRWPEFVGPVLVGTLLLVLPVQSWHVVLIPVLPIYAFFEWRRVRREPYMPLGAAKIATVVLVLTLGFLVGLLIREELQVQAVSTTQRPHGAKIRVQNGYEMEVWFLDPGADEKTFQNIAPLPMSLSAFIDLIEKRTGMKGECSSHHGYFSLLFGPEREMVLFMHPDRFQLIGGQRGC